MSKNTTLEFPQYKMYYIDADHKKHEVAVIKFLSSATFAVIYTEEPFVSYPGLKIGGEKTAYDADILWRRVPGSIKSANFNRKIEAFDEFTEKYRGMVATDRFAFVRA